MAVIHLLSQNTIDQIAAGEVVERPRSVVKELTENAIDARATAISVEIKEGGISLIRVTDNGSGIEKSEIRKAFLRHATSKIEDAQDLPHIHSLGFRGEALSSICAVSQMELITKTQEDFTGVHYQIEGGAECEFSEIGAPKGTTFLVRNLFYNVPARRKFLKQPQTEGSYVADLMEHLALSHPDISIKFIVNGQVRFQTSGNNQLKEVIYRIYGKEVTEHLIDFSLNGKSVRVRGFLGKPEQNRSNRNFEIFFVNGRYVHNDVLQKAVEEGYKQYLMQHKFPFCVLHFEFEPEDIDVNVHPAKMEIRLQHGAEVYAEIAAAIRDRLHEIELIPDVLLTEEKEQTPQIRHAPEPFEMNRTYMERIQEPVREMVSEEETPYQAKLSVQKILGDHPVNTTESDLHHNIIKSAEHILVEKPVQLDLFEENFVDVKSRESYQILGQIFDTYWLIAFKDKLFIMDQHAAHEKVKYERLVKELKNKTVTSQQITPPVVLHLDSKEEQALLSYRDYFTSLGFEIEEFGTGSVAIRSMPVDLYGCEEMEFFREVLDELCENPMKDQPDVILNKLASMACKAAVKGNNGLTFEEVSALLDEMLTLDNPYHCPHGRPTIISMSKYEIEKKFKRIVT
ncbi:MAG: DNA mismatch repair endonuclease MutL [Lachnospiraceae bacterium]|nr:DNA mismatch repair endonuclease MutL [Lachnospiraceae bacterium]